jgi:hypothetical protein
VIEDFKFLGFGLKENLSLQNCYFNSKFKGDAIYTSAYLRILVSALKLSGAIMDVTWFFLTSVFRSSFVDSRILKPDNRSPLLVIGIFLPFALCTKNFEYF